MTRLFSVRRVAIGLGVVLVCATGVAAQDYFHATFSFASHDYPLPESPCVIQGSAQPVVYDRSAWVFYTCVDGRVIARRFFHPNDNVPDPFAPKSEAPPVTPAPAACDPTKMVGFTNLNECEWNRRYPR